MNDITHDTSAPRTSDTPRADDFSWTDAFLLGYGPMDVTHEEFVACVRQMLDSPKDEFSTALKKFEVHAQRHFAEEAEWMMSSGFPATECHMQEHEQVLFSVQQVRQNLEAGGDLAIGTSLAQELARWFPGHADYMDAALAHWMVKRRHGGAPVVLRRNVQNV